jgi:hypothetical protein
MQIKYEDKYKEKIITYIEKYAQMKDIIEHFNVKSQISNGQKDQQNDTKKAEVKK